MSESLSVVLPAGIEGSIAPDCLICWRTWPADCVRMCRLWINWRFQKVKILEARLDLAVVFTDIQMPGSISGLKLARTIGDRWLPIKIVATSGSIESIQRQSNRIGIRIARLRRRRNK